jgi:hypothetical protein
MVELSSKGVNNTQLGYVLEEQSDRRFQTSVYDLTAGAGRERCKVDAASAVAPQRRRRQTVEPQALCRG